MSLSETIAFVDSHCAMIGESVRQRCGDPGYVLCEGMIAKTKASIIAKIARVQEGLDSLEGKRAIFAMKNDELQVNLQLLTAERTSNMDELQRLYEQTLLLTHDTKRQHVCRAAIECALAYRQLDVDIIASIEAGLAAREGLYKDIEAWSKEIKALKGLGADMVKSSGDDMFDLGTQVERIVLGILNPRINRELRLGSTSG